MNVLTLGSSVGYHSLNFFKKRLCLHFSLSELSKYDVKQHFFEVLVNNDFV